MQKMNTDLVTSEVDKLLEGVDVDKTLNFNMYRSQFLKKAE